MINKWRGGSEKLAQHALLHSTHLISRFHQMPAKNKTNKMLSYAFTLPSSQWHAQTCKSRFFSPSGVRWKSCQCRLRTSFLTPLNLYDFFVWVGAKDKSDRLAWKMMRSIHLFNALTNKSLAEKKTRTIQSRRPCQEWNIVSLLQVKTKWWCS